MPALHAALDAGASALYLGLKQLNARYGAQNFTVDELRRAVALAHQANAKVFLTLNTDLAQREVALAARCLAVAAECGVDAALVRDPGLLAMRPHFPQLAFHFSTQAGVSSSAGVVAARRLGISRAVLARELSLAEIAAASSVPDMETEVFVQGALCFSCSGRCLLSSWGGGRSGNRGQCASPCRVGWTASTGKEGRFLSMHDLCLADWVSSLAKAGVKSLKIEGRLKSPAWVSRAVSLYRRILDGELRGDSLMAEARALGDYTGRALTDGYLRGDRNQLTGEDLGRGASCSGPAFPPEPKKQTVLDIQVVPGDNHSTLWRFLYGEKELVHRTPPQKIANPKRAVRVAEALERMAQSVPDSLRGATLLDNALDNLLLPRNAVNRAQDELTGFLRNLSRTEDGLPHGVTLPPAVQRLVARNGGAISPENARRLGDKPDRCRVLWQDAATVAAALPNVRLVIQCAPLNETEAVQQGEAALALRSRCDAVALPQICYEGQLDALRALLRAVVSAGLAVEVNSWDTWQLATEAGAVMEAGPGLQVLNALAAAKLQELGCTCVSVACEIDAEQLQDLCAAATTPLSLTIFARPPLMSTRVDLPTELLDKPLEDSRRIVLIPSREGAVTVLRPSRPMDWRGLSNPAVRVAHLVLDLCGLRALPPRDPKPFLFNYDRRLR